jgi:hypothetical protein
MCFMARVGRLGREKSHNEPDREKRDVASKEEEVRGLEKGRGNMRRSASQPPHFEFSTSIRCGAEAQLSVRRRSLDRAM